MSTKFKVCEIFKSINGEGPFSGYVSSFIRLHGCNENCSYCDSRYSCDGDDYKLMSIEDILNEISTIDPHNYCQRVTLTGGEPLIQSNIEDLINALTSRRYYVEIETNGSIPLGPIRNKLEHSSNVYVTMDWKSLSSNMSNFNCVENLSRFGYQGSGLNTSIKFVVSNIEDLDQMKSTIETYHLRCMCFVSPVFGAIDPQQIVDYLCNNNLPMVRLQLQLHKFIWDPNKRGV